MVMYRLRVISMTIGNVVSVTQVESQWLHNTTTINPSVTRCGGNIFVRVSRHWKVVKDIQFIFINLHRCLLCSPRFYPTFIPSAHDTWQFTFTVVDVKKVLWHGLRRHGVGIVESWMGLLNKLRCLNISGM